MTHPIPGRPTLRLLDRQSSRIHPQISRHLCNLRTMRRKSTLLLQAPCKQNRLGETPRFQQAPHQKFLQLLQQPHSSNCLITIAIPPLPARKVPLTTHGAQALPATGAPRNQLSDLPSPHSLIQMPIPAVGDHPRPASVKATPSNLNCHQRTSQMHKSVPAPSV